ncbi:MSMEG_0567/sll0787 family protein [Gordonia sp. NPDC003424]
MLDGRSVAPQPIRTRDLSILAGTTPTPPAFLIRVADDRELLAAHHVLRHREFVERQALFDHTDHDDADDDPRTVVLVATTPDGTVIGGVRLSPNHTDDIGWWSGSRLVVADPAHAAGVGAALVRAACAHAESIGVLRFDATVQDRYAPMFGTLGWHDHGAGPVFNGRSHRRMRWPIRRVQHTADATKAMLADVLRPLASQPGGLGPTGFRGDDGVPVPDSALIAACDAVLPSMVERDPEWAGWCSILVNVNDLSAMGADPIGFLDAVGAPTRSHLTRIIRGVAAAAQAWQTPVLGGHTQVGVPASLSVTALGRAECPVAAGGGRAGDTVSLLADLGGSWRPGYGGRQWDSTSHRTATELASMAGLVGALQPRAAKDVSMAGIAGTLGMLAEASGTGAELDVTCIPRPAGADMGAWLTCFPGYAMLVADRSPVGPVGAPVTTAACGRLTAEPGVRLRWPDGEATTAVTSSVTGLGAA